MKKLPFLKRILYPLLFLIIANFAAMIGCIFITRDITVLVATYNFIVLIGIAGDVYRELKAKD